MKTSGRRKEAADIFKSLARFNGIRDFDINEEDLPPAPPPAEKTAHVWNLFSTLQLAKYSFCAMLTWFVVSMIKFGMYFNAGNLPFNMYITQVTGIRIYNEFIHL